VAVTTDTRTRMLDAAEQLFRIQGLHATGLAEVLEKSGAPRGSLYHYFPGGKEQLAIEALRSASAQIRDALEEFIGSGSSPEALRAYGRQSARRLVATDFAEGCPVGNTALEAAVGSPALRQACDEAFREWEGVIAAGLVADGVGAEQAAGLATFILSTFEGALLVARARRDPSPLVDSGENLAAIVEAALARQ
jgi:TetR/AcrR family transcriptional regulator, lmrAB and yxaGH operons repressor